MPAIREKAQLMSASEIDRTVVRLAHEVLEKNSALDQLAFIGIRRRGVPLAQRLARKIEALEKVAIPVGTLDINLYRDDLSTVGVKPVVSATDIPFSLPGRRIILTDDVLYTAPEALVGIDANIGGMIHYAQLQMIEIGNLVHGLGHFEEVIAVLGHELVGLDLDRFLGPGLPARPVVLRQDFAQGRPS